MALELTGERTVPGIPEENYWFQRHVAAYLFAAQRCAGKRVLDAGSGEGYGCALLSDIATSVVGVELVGDVVGHARTAYPTLQFLQADLCEMPIDDSSVDVVVSLQVIEHLPDIGRYLDEIARVLVPGGELICATPNRLTFTPDSDAPVNVFHVKEFTAAELRETLATRFDVEAVLGVHHGPAITDVERDFDTFFPNLVLSAPPERWPGWLQAVVSAIRPSDFVIHGDEIDASLDLVALATNRAGRTA